MSSHVESIDVEQPVRVVYDQWTQLESFPRFMDNVESIKQTTDGHAHWTINIAGVKREFDAKITEQHLDERIAWNTVNGPDQAGVVTFHKLSPSTTRVTLQMDFAPEGIAETAGDKLGFVSSSVKKSLDNFKEFIEDRDGATGAWHGDISN
jgi:uncharacterized membrane protein